MVSVSRLAWMSHHVYDERSVPSGCTRDWSHSSSAGFDSSFYSCVFSFGRARVFCFRGTDSGWDFASGNVSNALIGMSGQASTAATFVSLYMAQHKGMNFEYYLTGHSLGGALAQIVGKQTGLPAVTFCAPGVANFIGGTGASNILNILVRFDIVSNIAGQLGAKHWLTVDYGNSFSEWFSWELHKHSIKNLAAFLDIKTLGRADAKKVIEVFNGR